MWCALSNLPCQRGLVQLAADVRKPLPHGRGSEESRPEESRPEESRSVNRGRKIMARIDAAVA